MNETITLNSQKILFIGGGNMASSIIGGLIQNGLPPQNIRVKEPNAERAKELHTLYGVDEGEQINALESDVVVLAIKPQVMHAVLSDLDGQLKPGVMVLSVAAGITIASLSSGLKNSEACLIRTMPNTPALIGCGATVLYGHQLSESQKKLAQSIMQSVGMTAWVEKESDLDAVTALSGSGPAYYFLLMESLINSASQMGLEKNLCHQLAIQTAYGAAMLAKKELEKAQGAGDTPADLRKKVTSPGGTTAAAIDHMIEAGLPEIILKATHKARDRSIELGKPVS